MGEELLSYLISEACLGVLGWYALPLILFGAGVWLIVSGVNLWWGIGCIAAALFVGILVYRNRTTGDDL